MAASPAKWPIDATRARVDALVISQTCNACERTIRGTVDQLVARTKGWCDAGPVSRVLCRGECGNPSIGWDYHDKAVSSFVHIPHARLTICPDCASSRSDLPVQSGLHRAIGIEGFTVLWLAEALPEPVHVAWFEELNDAQDWVAARCADEGSFPGSFRVHMDKSVVKP